MTGTRLARYNRDVQMQLRVAVVDGTVEIRAKGELDHEGGPVLAEAAIAALEDGASSAIVDCSELTFVDSMGLRALIEIHKAAGAQSGDLILRAPRPMMQRVLGASGLDELFTINQHLG